MFTGIIEELGIVKGLSRWPEGQCLPAGRQGWVSNSPSHKGAALVLSIKADKAKEAVRIGDSIAVNGVCLTIIKLDKELLSFELLDETSKLTNLGKVKVGEKVNLERALRIGDRLSGHFVTGHIDCLGIIRNKRYVLGNLCFEIAIPEKFLKFIVPKGSIAVDGISLTVVNKRSNIFSVYVISHTLQNTALIFKGPSDCVNIEFDILAKYHQ